MALVQTISGVIQNSEASQETGLVHTFQFLGVIADTNIQLIQKANVDFGVPYAITIPIVPAEIYDGIHAMGVFDVLDPTIFVPPIGVPFP